jgi:arylsulfatase A-like enzyme
MVERMDFNVGRVINWLVDHDLIEKTIIVFTSDNGGVDFPQRGILPTSNAPLRSGKGTLYEGGIRIPLLIHWPGVTQTGTCDEMVSSQDFFPTFTAYLGDYDIPVPQGPIDGVNLLPLLSGQTSELARDTLYWHFPHYYPRMTPGSSMRRGDWKLIHYYEDDRTELFDLGMDPGEQKDLSQQQSDVAAAMRQSLEAWRAAIGANAPSHRQ